MWIILADFWLMLSCQSQTNSQFSTVNLLFLIDSVAFLVYGFLCAVKHQSIKRRYQIFDWWNSLLVLCLQGEAVFQNLIHAVRDRNIKLRIINNYNRVTDNDTMELIKAGM